MSLRYYFLTVFFAFATVVVLFKDSDALAQTCSWTQSGDYVCGASVVPYNFPVDRPATYPPVYSDEYDEGDVDQEIAVIAAQVNQEAAQNQKINQMLEAGSQGLTECEQAAASTILEEYMIDSSSFDPDNWEMSKSIAEAAGYTGPLLEIRGGIKYFMGRPLNLSHCKNDVDMNQIMLELLDETTLQRITTLEKCQIEMVNDIFENWTNMVIRVAVLNGELPRPHPEWSNTERKQFERDATAIVKREFEAGDFETLVRDSDGNMSFMGVPIKNCRDRPPPFKPAAAHPMDKYGVCTLLPAQANYWGYPMDPPAVYEAYIDSLMPWTPPFMKDPLRNMLLDFKAYRPNYLDPEIVDPDTKIPSRAPISMSDRDTVTITGVHITNPDGPCIELENVKTVVIVDSIIGPCGGEAISIKGAEVVSIKNTHIEFADAGIVVTDSQNVSVINSEIRNVMRGEAIYLGDVQQGYIAYNSIDNAIATGSPAEGILIENTTGTAENPFIIEHNQIKHNSSSCAIKVGPGLSDNVVVNNNTHDPHRVGGGCSFDLGDVVALDNATSPGALGETLVTQCFQAWEVPPELQVAWGFPGATTNYRLDVNGDGRPDIDLNSADRENWTFGPGGQVDIDGDGEWDGWISVQNNGDWQWAWNQTWR